METELVGAGGVFSLPDDVWEAALAIAVQHGWDGYHDYTSLSDFGAQALADAIEKALPEIPDQCSVVAIPDDPAERRIDWVVDEDVVLEASFFVKVTPAQFLSGPRKAIIISLLEFCRAGEFSISEMVDVK